MTTRFIPVTGRVQKEINLGDDPPLSALLPPIQETPAAAEPTTTTTTGPARRVSRQQVQTVAGIGLGLGVAIALIVLIGNVAPPRPAAPSRTVPTTAPAAPTAPTPAAPAPTVAALPIAAFWAPGGDAAPAIQAGDVFTPTARYGSTWIAVDLPGGGSVWIGRGDAEKRGRLPNALPDLAATAPPPSPPAPVSVPAGPPPAPVCGDFARTLDVASSAGVPLGVVTGRGCTQADADANADVLAAQMRGSR